jgi:O-antigen biosynthesis protein
MPPAKTLVTDAKKLLGLTYEHFHTHGASATARKAASYLRTQALRVRPGPEAQASVASLIRNSSPALTPLNGYSTPRAKPRLNLLLDGLSVDRLYGNTGRAVVLGALLAEQHSWDLRLITRHRRADQQGFAHLMKLAGITLPGHVEFKHAACEAAPTDIDLGERELFLTTSCATTWATLQTVAPDKIIYLVQEDERLLHPHGEERLRCEALLKTPQLTFIVGSQLLFAHLLRDGIPDLAQRGSFFEPAIPAELFFPPPPAPESGPWRFFYYARPRSPQNLFFLGLAAIEQAVLLGILNKDQWEFHFAGQDIPRLVLGSQVEPRLYENLSDNAYAALVRKMDLGLCLLAAPEPSQPALELSASGAVAVTSRFGEKQSLAQYSDSILCVEPTVQALVAGLEQGVRRAKERSRRLADYRQSRISRDFRTSFAPVLGHLASRLS